jgi:hypothetical protein
LNAIFCDSIKHLDGVVVLSNVGSSIVDVDPLEAVSAAALDMLSRNWLVFSEDDVEEGTSAKQQRYM